MNRVTSWFGLSIATFAACKHQQSYEQSTIKKAETLNEWIDESIGQEPKAIDDYFSHLIAQGRCKVLSATDPASLGGLVNLACLAPDDQHGPQREQISQIVIHNTEESIQDTMRIFLGEETSQGYRNNVSIHIIISRTGLVIRNLADNFVGFHTGSSTQNRISLGVELEASGTFADGKPTNPRAAIRAGGMTSVQMQKLIQLVNKWRQEYGIGADKVVHHHSISSGTACPISIFPRQGAQDSFWEWRDLSFKQNMQVEVKSPARGGEGTFQPSSPSQEVGQAMGQGQDQAGLALPCHQDGNQAVLFPIVSLVAEYQSLLKSGNSSEAESLGELLQEDQFTIFDAFHYTDHRDSLIIFAIKSSSQSGYILASQAAPTCLLQLQTTGSIKDLKAPTDCVISETASAICR